MWHKLQTYTLGIGALLLGAAVVMVFASVATALLILRDASAPVGAMPPAAGPSQISASEAPQPETAPAPQPGAPYDSENASPIVNEQRIFTLRGDPKVSSAVERTPAPSTSTRTKALETVDARELLRQAKTRK